MCSLTALILPIRDRDHVEPFLLINGGKAPSRARTVVHVTMAVWFGTILGAGGCGALVLPVFFPYAFMVGAFLGLLIGFPLGLIAAAATLKWHYPMVEPDRFRRMFQWFAFLVVNAIIIPTGISMLADSITHSGTPRAILGLTLWFAWSLLSNQFFGHWIANLAADSYLATWTNRINVPADDVLHVIQPDGGWYE